MAAEPTRLELAAGRLPSRAMLLARALGPGRRPETLEYLPELVVRDLPIDGSRLKSYCELCGFGERGQVPLPYFFVLGFLPQVTLVTHPAFPLKAMGMVHVANTFEGLEAVHPDETLDVTVRATGLETVEKGRQVTVETLFLRRRQTVARSVSVNFARGAGHGEAPPPKERQGPPTTEPVSWHLDSAVGRRYAAVSGDYNPIHLYPLSARVLGFRRQIAHGMYLVARAVAAVESGRKPMTGLQVRFKTPTYLPSQPRFYVDPVGTSFELWDERAERPHLMGQASSGR